jgi:hypothetical protein
VATRLHTGGRDEGDSGRDKRCKQSVDHPALSHLPLNASASIAPHEPRFKPPLPFKHFLGRENASDHRDSFPLAGHHAALVLAAAMMAGVDERELPPDPDTDLRAALIEEFVAPRIAPTMASPTS